MAKQNHIGQGVIVISSMPFQYNPYWSPEMTAPFQEFAQSVHGKYLFAITADKYQRQSRDFIESLGFKSVLSFLSSHGYKDETLTMWLKTEDIEASKEEITYPDTNCTVTYVENGSTFQRVCKIVTALDKESKKLTKEGYRNIENTPIWFKLDKRYEVQSPILGKLPTEKEKEIKKQ